MRGGAPHRRFPPGPLPCLPCAASRPTADASTRRDGEGFLCAAAGAIAASGPRRSGNEAPHPLDKFTCGVRNALGGVRSHLVHGVLHGFAIWAIIPNCRGPFLPRKATSTRTDARSLPPRACRC